MTASESRLRNVPAGSHRTRTVSYSGYGAAGFPLIEVPEVWANAHPELKNLRWAEHDGTRILLAPNARTMAINNRFDLAKNPMPPPPLKFTPNHPDRIRPRRSCKFHPDRHSAHWCMRHNFPDSSPSSTLRRHKSRSGIHSAWWLGRPIRSRVLARTPRSMSRSTRWSDTPSRQDIRQCKPSRCRLSASNRSTRCPCNAHRRHRSWGAS